MTQVSRSILAILAMAFLGATVLVAGTSVREGGFRQSAREEHAATASTLREKTADQSTSPDADEKTLPGRIFVNAFIRDTQDRISLWIVAVDPETGDWIRLVNEANFPRVSPDGRTLAYLKSDIANDIDGIWTCEIDAPAQGRRISQISSRPPVWSGDGEEFLITDEANDTSPHYKSWRFDSDGDHQKRITIPRGHWITDWSPDGRSLVTGAPGRKICILKLDGTIALTLPEPGHNGRFSPDGRHLAFDRKYTRQPTIHVIDADGGNSRTVFSGGNAIGRLPCWSPDGEWLVFLVEDRELDAAGVPLPNNVVNGDPDRSHPRLVFVHVESGRRRVLNLSKQDGVKRIWPTHEFDWR